MFGRVHGGYFGVVRMCKECERGVIGQGPDSSFGGVPVGYCLGDDHMEEEVQVRVQVEVEREGRGIGETRGK